ncbi:MAG: LysR family transcriptional regulator [Halomonas sp.]|jgi:DNA-binding transcriptional LysR family regulator|uniref:LysR family transcriptional regulator n=1 Tax=Billgrantia tianxiuensis TaxID=2497861 RepID=A0A6I6SPM6_9GAMM|nr:MULTISPECIES: LysR family transcriptional regulator [Halomonas]MCE8032215.1 LysR family transcriptional regulator [Halomonas sp. MCCC 1A11057]MDX5431995.1 LysR family transcriptional regulator [Halomonas sp.]QHC49770.1 LysR family transcriptional regulator [Halomonas tianxiuensis]
MQDLNDLFYFASVAEHGSFTAAAHALGMPKSTLSRRISQLEERLEVRLLHRTTRRLTLTDTGRAYLTHCHDLLAAAEAAEGVIEQVRETPRGRVVMSSPISLSQTLLARALPEFMLRFPRVEVELNATNRRVDLIAEGVDLALRVRSRLEDSSLVSRQFAVSTAVLVASPALVEQLGSPEVPADLERFPSLSMRFADGRHALTLTEPSGTSQTVSLTPRFVTDDMQALQEAAIAGIGLVALPSFVCRAAVATGELQVLLPHWQLPDGQVHAVYPYRRGLRPAVRHLIDFLAQRLPSLAEEMGISHPGQALNTP